MTASTQNHGRFVWHDLMSKDPEKSKSFYTELFGWRIESRDMGAMGTYDMLHAGKLPIGGIVPLTGPGTEEVPSHWVGYVDTDDIEACVKRCEGGGGKICVPITEIPDTGKFAVITDPLNAVISPFQSAMAEAPPIPDTPLPGTFCWNELHTSDSAGSKSFYGETFGWEYRDMDMGPMGTYHIAVGGGKDAAGMMPLPPEAPAPPSWLSYIAVEDPDATAAKAAGLGAQTMVPPTDIPDMGRFAVFLDPTGGVFAIYRPNA